MCRICGFVGGPAIVGLRPSTAARGAWTTARCMAACRCEGHRHARGGGRRPDAHPALKRSHEYDAANASRAVEPASAISTNPSGRSRRKACLDVRGDEIGVIHKVSAAGAAGAASTRGRRTLAEAAARRLQRRLRAVEVRSLIARLCVPGERNSNCTCDQVRGPAAREPLRFMPTSNPPEHQPRLPMRPLRQHLRQRHRIPRPQLRHHDAPGARSSRAPTTPPAPGQQNPSRKAGPETRARAARRWAPRVHPPRSPASPPQPYTPRYSPAAPPAQPLEFSTKSAATAPRESASSP